jgi:hypothetical protein
MRRQDVQDATGRSEYNPGYGQMRAWGSGVPTNGQQGFAPGCLYQNLTGTIGTAFYINVGTFASSRWLNADNPDGGLVNLAATTTLTALLHAGRTLLLNLAGGFTSTLPAATGTGLIYRFIVQTVSTTGYVISAAGSDKIKGTLQVVQPGSTYATANIAESFLSTANANVTLNGTATGGANIGDWVQLQDIAAGLWVATGLLTASTTPTTPFS